MTLRISTWVKRENSVIMSGGVTLPTSTPALALPNFVELNMVADRMPSAEAADKPIRTPISKRTRFEIFKRDKFTCQYCGRMAPDVVLHCDHVKPVAGGGTGDVLNLITSCKDCNLGKAAVPLSDRSAISKQATMLAELEDRRQQLDMMMEWRDELQNVQIDHVSAIERVIAQHGGGVVNESGRSSIRKWLKKYPFEEIVSALDDCFDRYLVWVGDKFTDESWNVAFKRVPSTIEIVREEASRPYLRRLLYIQGILRRRSRTPRLNRIDYLEHLHLCGEPLDILEGAAARAEDFIEFEKVYDEWLRKIGKVF